MNDFKDWCRVFVVIIIFSGVIFRLLPKSKVNNSVKTLFSIVVLSFIIVPFFDKETNVFSHEFSFDEAVLDESELLTYGNDFASKLSEEIIEAEVNKYLVIVDEQAYVEKVEISTDNNQVSDVKIEIFGVFSEEEKEKICNYIIGLCKGGVKVEFYE